jgi:nucleoside-diphosphate-sugar epimerase
MKKVLVTGHQGYIGVHLVDLLRKEGHHVTGCDLQLFAGCEWEPFVRPHHEYARDFRSLTVQELAGFDCVMHLAAISNDPMGDLDPSITYGVNRDGTISLAKKAKQAGVPRFLFASSCSIYGNGANLDIDETGETSPLSAYASSKIAAEEMLQELADASFTTISLRNATAYGHSPMLRIDLVVNNLLACGLSRGEIRVLSDGSPWRPLIHCKDIARAFSAFLDVRLPGKHSLAVNVGSNRENYQVRDVLEKVRRLIPSANVTYTGEVGADPRNYRVNFDLLGKVLPAFTLEYTLDKGMEDLYRKYKDNAFCLADFEGDKFVRLRMLKKSLHKVIGSGE